MLDHLRHIKSRAHGYYSLACDYVDVAAHRMEAVQFNHVLKKRLTETQAFLPSVDRPGTVAFNLVRTNGFQPWIEFSLAYLLAAAGHETHIFYDDGLLAQWDDVQAHQLSGTDYASVTLTDARRAAEKKQSRRLLHRATLQNRFRAFEHDRLTIHPYSNVVDTDCLTAVSLPEGHEDHARSSTIRFFGTDDIDFDNPEVQAFHRRARTNNQVSSTVGKSIIQDLQPDLFVTSHGIYSTWGCCYDVVSQYGVPSMVYAIHGSRPHHLWLFDAISQDVASSPDWQDKKDSLLSREAENRVKKYMEARVDKKTFDNQVYYENLEVSNLPKNIQNFLGEERHIEQGQKSREQGVTFGLFPNVPWDGNVSERNTVFDGVVQWITQTIRQIAGTEHRLVVRYHPSEATMMKGARALSSIVEDHVEIDRIENVLAIPSDEKVDTYRLLDFIDLGLVYDGTLATEMTYLDIPVIAVGRGRFSQKDWAYMPSSQQKYSQWIKSPAPILSDFVDTREERWEACRRFVHWINFESSYDFPLLQHEYPIRLGRAGDLEPRDIINARMKKVLDRLQKEITP